MNASIKVDASSALAKLNALVPNARAAAKRSVGKVTRALADAVRANVPVGRLRDAIRFEVDDSGGNISGCVFTDSSVAYARIREFGGTIEIPEMVPRQAKALAFPYEGKLVFAAHTKAHVVTIPAKPFAAPALAAFAPGFKDKLGQAVGAALA